MHVVKTLPAAPQILSRLGQLRLEPNADLDDVTALLRCDAALTARILRIANSPAYTTGSPYASLGQALARVGFGEIYKIAGFATIAQMADQNLVRYGVTGPQLRENSLLTALIMEELAAFAQTDAHEAYSAGLLRSTGKVALESILRDSTMAAAYDPQNSGRLQDWETSLTGLCNCDAAAFILTEWRFPASIIAAIGRHYSPQEAVSEPVLTSLLNLAAGAADRAGFGLQCERANWLHSPEKWEAAGVDEDQLRECLQKALEQFGNLRSAIS
jgi:HD-like signal output (HDOD) protein